MQGGGAGDEAGAGVAARVAQEETAQREADGYGEPGAEENGER